MLPAHGHPFADLAGRAKEIHDHHQERLDTLRAAAAELGSASVEDLSHRLFKERSWGQMAESETYAHLEHLRAIGEADSPRRVRHPPLPPRLTSPPRSFSAHRAPHSGGGGAQKVSWRRSVQWGDVGGGGDRAVGDHPHAQRITVVAVTTSTWAPRSMALRCSTSARNGARSERRLDSASSTGSQ